MCCQKAYEISKIIAAGSYIALHMVWKIGSKSKPQENVVKQTNIFGVQRPVIESLSYTLSRNYLDQNSNEE